ncbi:MAG: XylR N-terminal domain-containing protein [Myxococcota bacterium]|nr:XylR N-terminal domain-containing protein [Myxococcota bacterium]
MAARGGDAPERALRTNLDDGLVCDARILVDPRLLGVLQSELEERLGADEAAAVMLQTGFFHGLRDARRALALTGGQTAAPLLAMQLRMRSDPTVLAAAGAWPDRVEAEAVLASQGRRLHPACFLSSGYASGWLSGLWDVEVLAVERACAARGDATCDFEVRETVAWRQSGEPAALGLLDALPYAALHDVVDDRLGETCDEPRAHFERGSPAIHVWGPVMVVPYAGAQTAAAVEAVAREPDAVGISVVVVDLEGAIVDDGFGAEALERTVDVIHSWGAETVISGPSPLAARVVAGLACAPVAVRKDLEAAIATAFQIAESQRQLL